jgi:5-formyltetrahydrofolate cyclo-ligase
MSLQLNSRDNGISLRNSIRISMRQKRRNLSPLKQKLNAKKIATQLINLQQLKQAKKIAVYLSHDGEINLLELIKQLWKRNKQCYLPVLNKKRSGYLLFLPYDKNQKMIKNRFKIREPVYNYRNSQLAKQLDIILMPLVGFDKQANRIGMGGGYYDRSLSYMEKETNKRPVNQKPLLIGVAHSIQAVEKIPVAAWDVRLNMIVTNNKCYQSG